MTKAKKGYRLIGSEYPHIEDGAKVYLRSGYVGEGDKPWRYFVTELTDGFCLLADSKKMFNEHRGYIYSIWSIEQYQVFN